jgi:ribonuclease HI
VEEVTVYTDGACEGNPGPGGYAAIIDRRGKRNELTGSERQTTNNRMELLAVIAALRSLEEPASVRIVTDSQYVAKGMTSWIHNWRRKGWKTASGAPVKNRDLWEELDELSRRHRVRWEWIRGHNGHPGNERADTLAREAIQLMRDSSLP